MYLGDIDDSELLSILKSICIRLHISWPTSPNSLHETVAYLKAYMEGISNL